MKLALAVLLLAADGAAAPDRSVAIIEQTHAFIRAFDAADVPALEKLLAPGFVRADSARLWPREVYLRSVVEGSTPPARAEETPGAADSWRLGGSPEPRLSRSFATALPTVAPGEGGSGSKRSRLTASRGIVVADRGVGRGRDGRAAVAEELLHERRREGFAPR